MSMESMGPVGSGPMCQMGLMGSGPGPGPFDFGGRSQQDHVLEKNDVCHADK